MTFQTTFDEKVQFLNKELIHKYESALAERKKMSERWNRPGSKKQQLTREIFQKSNVDLKALDELEKQSFIEQQEFLNEIRPELISRAPKSLEGRSRLAMKCAAQSGSQVIPLLGTTLLAGGSCTASLVKAILKEKGNPWILPWNPGQVKIKVAQYVALASGFTPQEHLDPQRVMIPLLSKPSPTRIYSAFL